MTAAKQTPFEGVSQTITQSCIIERAIVFAATTLFYVLLLSDMPVDDAARYVHELTANRFFWDIGHVWIQPIALILHRILGAAVSVTHVLEAVNVLACAGAMTIFFHTLRSLGVGLWRAALSIALVAVSFNLLSLGPTAHIKLVVFPALALAIHHAVFWERAILSGLDGVARRNGILAGAWLGFGSTLLVSVLPMAPFMAACIAWRLWQRKGKVLMGVVPFAVATFLCGALSLIAAYVTALLSATTDRGFIDFVLLGLADKQAIHPGFYGFLEIPFRVIYSSIYNFVFLPDLGTLGRAAMWGVLPDVASYMPRMARDAFMAVLSGGILLALVASCIHQVRRAAGLLMPMAFLVGALCFSTYENVNDPEHWFQITLPLVMIAALCRWRWLAVLVFVVWLPLLTLDNLALYGIPKASFAFAERQQALRDAIGTNGLYVGFDEYPGEPDTSLFALGNVDKFRVDRVHREAYDGDRTIALLQERIDAALARHGRVLVFRALDPSDWRGPMLAMHAAGLSKTKVASALQTRYELRPVQIAGFPAVEILGLAAKKS